MNFLHQSIFMLCSHHIISMMQSWIESSFYARGALQVVSICKALFYIHTVLAYESWKTVEILLKKIGRQTLFDIPC